MPAVNITDNVSIELKDLATHVAVFGKSGGGKSGAIISICEQVLEQQVPVLLIDLKGDLINIIQRDQADTFPIVLTPGAKHGDPVDLFSNFSTNIEGTATYLLKLIGIESSRTQEAYHAYLCAVLRAYKGTSLRLEKLLPLVANPPFSTLGLLDLDEVIPPAQRKTLVIKINNLIANESFAVWREGVSLNFDYLFRKRGGKTPVVIYSVAHLVNEEERMLALSFLFGELLSWTLRQTGSHDLRAIMVLDECQNLLPPAPKNPVTKTPIMSLLKQARAFGVGVILGTQNVKAIDYQALGQCSTWVVGQLKTKHDRTRILEGMSHLAYSEKQLDNKMAGLVAREFLVTSGAVFGVGKTLDCKSRLSGPVTSHDVEMMKSSGIFRSLAHEIKETQPKSSFWDTFFNKGK